MNKITKSSLALALTLGVSQSAFAAWCAIDYVNFDPMLRAKVKAMSTSVKASIISPTGGAIKGNDLTSNVLKATQAQADQIIAATTILTTQKAMSTDHISDSINKNTQLEANARASVNQAQRITRATRDYGKHGMGYEVCKVNGKRQDIKEASETAAKAIQDMVNGEITARAGRYADRSEAMATRLALHKELYCTEGQAKAGLCSGVGERAGKSLMASTLFEPADYMSQEYNDKSAFINNMVGLPDDPVEERAVTTLSGQSYMDLKRRKDAIKSTAMTSLKAIQADWSSLPPEHESDTEEAKADKQKALNAADTKTEADQLDKDASKTEVATSNTDEADKNSSLMIQVKADVDRYLGGGEEYKNWSKVLTSQEEKGVLTEVLKVKALRLFLQTQEYQQLQRMEAMLAANVAATTESSGMSSRVEEIRQKAVRNRVKGNIVSGSSQ